MKNEILTTDVLQIQVIKYHFLFSLRILNDFYLKCALFIRA